MARGWESKSVEEQIEASSQGPTQKSAGAAADPAKARQLANLQLARTQVQRSLDACSNPTYRQQLEKALAELDAQIAAAHERDLS